jgi:hypothetical protein
MGTLTEIPMAVIEARMSPELRALWRATDVDGMTGRRFWEHAEPGRPTLVVQYSVDQYTLEDAFRHFLSIRRWKHLSVSVRGQWAIAMADQREIGRKRRGGERSPTPLPDWYDLTHLAYQHGAEVGFDPRFAVWQYLPPPDEPYLNIAEALHLRQPA